MSNQSSSQWGVLVVFVCVVLFIIWLAGGSGQ